MSSLRFLALLPLLACGDKDGASDSGAPGVAAFCADISEADTTLVVEGGGSGSSGLLDGWLITDESDNPRDPALVTNVDYTLENIDTGGSPISGKTNSDGLFTETLGEGRWLLRLADSKGGYTCRNELEFVIEAGNTTRMCLDIGCE